MDEWHDASVLFLVLFNLIMTSQIN